MADGGHTFGKKTFHKPTYCHHCSDLLWGLIGQGYICEVCNFIIHERCMSSVVTPCSGIAPCIIKNPIAHCWSEPTHHKRKFCTVCRKRLDETQAVHCLVCEYFAHLECQDFAVPDCTENATYVPGKELLNVKHQHHWREGNLPTTSKCAYCKKTCWSSECLTGYRCEWCGMTTHGGCRMYLPTECNFGVLQPIYLPPHSVSIPRTEVPVEAILGVQVKSKMSLVRDYSCPELSQLIDRNDAVGDGGDNEHDDDDDRVGAASPTTSSTAAAPREPLTIREILLIDRIRRAQAKRNFLLSSPTTPTPSTRSNSPMPSISPTPSPLPPPLIVVDESSPPPTTTTLEAERRPSKEEDFDQDSAVQLTAPASSATSSKNALQKSPSATSSLHLLYTNLFRKLHHQSRRRKHAASLTDDDGGGADDAADEGDDDEDRGVCDISGGDEFSDDGEASGEVALRRRLSATAKKRHRGQGGCVQPPGSFYETSDTGGDLTTTDDIDSSMNLISNLSYNSSNSNTSIDVQQRHSADGPPASPGALAEAADPLHQATQPTTTTTALLSATTGTQKKKKSASKGGDKKTGAPLGSGAGLTCMHAPSHHHKGGSVSSPNSSECSSISPVPSLTTTTAGIGSHNPHHHLLTPVGRSKSFQEPGVKRGVGGLSAVSSRTKKYARFFQRRRSKRSKPAATRSPPAPMPCQNIEITIQDEDGNFQVFDDDYGQLSCGALHVDGDDDCSELDNFLDLDDIEAPTRRNPLRCSTSAYQLDTHSSAQSVAAAVHHRPHSCGARSLSDDFCAADISDAASSGGLSGDTQNGDDVFGRLMRRMRGLSLGWRKARYHKRRARSISEEFSSGDTPRFKDEESVGKTESTHGVASGGASGSTGGAAGGSGGTPGGTASSSHYRPESSGHKSDKSEKDKDKKEKDREEKDIEMIKVFDGNNSFRRQLYRVIFVQRTYTLEQLLTTALRAFHITRDPSAFFMTDLYAPAGMEDTPLLDPNPVLSLTHVEGKRPAIYLRFLDKDKGFVRVYPGKLQCSLEDPYVSVPVDNTTVIKDLIRDALDKFGLQDNQIQDYRCSEVLLDRGVTERILSWNERPWDIMKQLGKDSIRQMELMRFYMQHKQDPHGPNIALFVGNLPPGLSQRNYEQILNKYVTDENKFTSIGPIYYEYGSVVLTFEDSQKAVRAFYNLRETIIEDKKLLVMLLPNIEPSMVPPDVRPLLVFVNVKSGGCQGLELISSFRKLLNPFQVFDLDNGGPLPGLYVFRQIANYKILVCGGDGTIGWVLQCLDNVGQDSECSSPPCAIVPLGTGNDLARVLCWGSGYTGGEDPLNLLRDVIEAEEIRLDRWTVVFHPEDKPEEPALKPPSNTTGGGAQNEDNSQIFVMNNYFGIGIDADLCLDFHNAREENPNKFNSRLHNKGYYVKMGLRKMVGRKFVKDLHKELRLEVDGKVIDVPPVEGIIILNILSWGSGANPWGPDKDDNFTTPNHYDGVLEIVGVTGVVHLGQIQSGIRTATRIAQGGHIKIHLFSDMPVQVDGEPWVQSPGDVVVLKSALKATMLKKNKGKMKRRNTEPTMMVAGGVVTPHMSLALPPAGDGGDTSDADNASNNTDF